MEKKWEEPFIETRRTPDLENMDLEQYQQSIAQYVKAMVVRDCIRVSFRFQNEF